MTEALVTVVVTTYNHERYVTEALESVLHQDAPFSYDVVVIDDCSTDGTADALQRLADRYPGRFSVRRAPVNRNDHHDFAVALDECTTPYVAVLDGDDYWTSPAKLARQVAYLDAHPDCMVVFHPVQRVDDDGDDLPDLPEPRWKLPRTRDDLWIGCFLQTCSVVFRRAAFDTVPRWYQDSVFGDWELYVVLTERGDVGVLDETMAAYRIHSAGMWTRMTALEQAHNMQRFYELMASGLGDAFRRNPVAVLSRDVALASVYGEAGARWRAWRWLLPAIARVLVRQPGPHAPSRRQVAGVLKRRLRADVADVRAAIRPLTPSPPGTSR